MKERKALLIGVPSYCSEEFPDLNVVRHDIESMKTALDRSNYQVAQFETDDMLVLSANNIRRTLIQAARNIRNVDTFVLYFSGHGFHYRSKDYIVPSDGFLDEPGFFEKSLISVYDICNIIGEADARTILFFVDACREGVAPNYSKKPGKAPRIPSLKRWSNGKIKEAMQRRVITIFGCGPGQRCRYRKDESFSYFTRALVDALDLECSARTLRQVYDETKDRLNKLLDEYHEKPQEPCFRPDKLISFEDEVFSRNICEGRDFMIVYARFDDLPVPGIPLNHDSPYYVQREADDLVKQCAYRRPDKNEKILVIQAPPKMGKSSLLRHYLSICELWGKKTILIDFSTFDEKDFKDGNCLVKIAQILQTAQNEEGGGQFDINRYFEEHFASQIDESFVIAFDVTEKALNWAYQANFFPLLRGWCHQNWNNINFALAIPTEFRLLIQKPHHAKFDAEHTLISLAPFTFEECRELNKKYGELLSEEIHVPRLYEIFQGHPYLIQCVYRELIISKNSFETVIQKAFDRDKSFFNSHLNDLRDKLNRNSEFKKVRQSVDSGVMPNDGLIEELYYTTGIVKKNEKSGQLEAVNRLYEYYFLSNYDQ